MVRLTAPSRPRRLGWLAGRAVDAEGVKSVIIAAHEVRGGGGQERVTLELIANLIATGWTVTLVTVRADIPQRPDLRIVRLPAPTRPAILTGTLFYVAAGAYIAIARRGRRVLTVGAIVPNQVDVVMLHFCRLYYYSRIRVTRVSRDVWWYRLNERLYRHYARIQETWTYRPGRVAAVAGVSQDVVDELVEMRPQARSLVRVAPNGVDSAYFSPGAEDRRAVRAEVALRSDQLVAAFVGGDWTRKGLFVIVEALALVPNWTLFVVGRGDAARLDQACTTADVASRVVAVGPQRDVRRFLRASDVYISASTYEGLSLALLEAAAVGLGIVVPAEMQGARMLLPPGYAGWAKRTPEGLAAALTRFSDDEVRKAAGLQARARAAGFTWKVQADAISALLQRSP